MVAQKKESDILLASFIDSFYAKNDSNKIK